MGFNFVVQKDNYRQIESFVKFAGQYAVDAIFFQRINFEMDLAYSDAEKKELDVCSENSPHYAEVAAVFDRLAAKNYGFAIHNNCISRKREQ